MTSPAIAGVLDAAPKGLVLHRPPGVSIASTSDVLCIPICDSEKARFTEGQLWLGPGRHVPCGSLGLRTLAEYLSKVLVRETARSFVADAGEDVRTGDELAVAYWHAITRATTEHAPCANGPLRALCLDADLQIQPLELLPARVAEIVDACLLSRQAQREERSLLWWENSILIAQDGRPALLVEGFPSLRDHLELLLHIGEPRRRVLAMFEGFIAERTGSSPLAVTDLRERIRYAGGRLYADAGPYEKILFIDWSEEERMWTLGAATPAFAHKTGVSDLYALWPPSEVRVELSALWSHSRRSAWLTRIHVGDDLFSHPFVYPGDATLCVEDTLARASSLERASGSGTGEQIRAELLAARDVVVYGYSRTSRPHQTYWKSIQEGRVAVASRSDATVWAERRGAEVVEW